MIFFDHNLKRHRHKASTTKGSLLGFCKQRNVGDQFSLVNLILRPSKSRSLIWLLLQSRNLTKMHPKMKAWKMIFPFEEVIFRSHVSFWGSRSTQLLHLRRIVKCSKQICFKCKKSCTQWHPICLCYVLCIRQCHIHWDHDHLLWHHLKSIKDDSATKIGEASGLPKHQPRE